MTDNYYFFNRSKHPVKAWLKGGVNLELEALEQAENLASLPFIHKHVALMPDVHVGIGATVGSVIATKGAIVPAAVGVEDHPALVAAHRGAPDGRDPAGVDLGDLEQKLDAARKLEAPREQWNDVAAILSSVDQAESAASLGALRKEVAARVLALPAALQSGVKAAVDARAEQLGAPTVASQLMARAKAAKSEEECQKVYDAMTEAAQARRITKADAEAITAVLNGERAAA